ncbi:CHASE3 domain-containing protein [Oxynema sp. CENA135]|uniref:methyl-accepting chemotaxis protein n=1 Tax=Oxynema sp. CENA135 TaxID=984206 RepID=UPI00190B0790|nr:methyl-accepting chemotaxis protein [Oxynema sp. CENA135]MBK4728448.1 CHASE3 domain-containing protein [Oxynema sp. CENA135]
MLVTLNMRNRMIFGYAIPVLIALGGLVALVYISADKVKQAFSKVEQVQEKILTVNEMVLAAEGMIDTSRGYLINQDPVFLTRYDEFVKVFEESSKKSEVLMQEDEHKEIVNNTIALIEEYRVFSDQLITLAREGKKAEATSLFSTGQGRNIVDRIYELKDKFDSVKVDSLKQENTTSTETLASLIFWLLIGSFALVIVVIIVAIFISSGITKIVKEATNAIASSSQEIAATIEQQERIINQQATSVNETTTTMNELGSSSKATAKQAESSAKNANEVLNLAESSAEGANQVLDLAQEGTASVGRTMEGMSQLQKKVESIAQEIRHLSEQNTQISTITNLVTDIANQTNMLALNAAVEAVRAGENGKGFGVIATEIRKLADQSKSSAQKINTLVINIEEAIESTVMVTEEGTKTVQYSMELSQVTAEAFAKVTEAIDNIILRNQEMSRNAIEQVVVNSQQISLTTKQQAIAINQVVEAMNTLNQGAVETVSGINQTRIGVQKLNEAAQDLNALV